ncbi:MAG: PrsW family intramembrane metalloprotease [Myxococcales bacterium]|nr:PrsW family intramembrane metalloprotease [Myxococcales bacterium]
MGSGITVEVSAFLLAVAPVAALLAAFRRADKARPEPLTEVARTMAAGIAVTVPVFATELALKHWLGDAALVAGRFLDAYLVAALVEEGAKLIVVMTVAFPRRAFDEFTDGVLYTGAASLGFGLLENLLYVSGWFAVWFCSLPTVRLLCGPSAMGPTETHHIVLGFVRALTAVPMHAVSGGLMGYFIGRARYPDVRPTVDASEDVVDLVPAVIPRKAAWCLLGLAVAVAVHGTYDWVVYAFGGRRLIFVALPLILGGASWALARLVRHSLSLDEALHEPGRRSSLVIVRQR